MVEDGILKCTKSENRPGEKTKKVLMLDGSG